MAKRNLQYVVGADVSGAKKGFKSLGSSIQGLSKTINRLVGVAASIQGIRALGSSFISAAAQMEGYQTKLRAVIKNAMEADAVFKRVYDWAAENPINTDEAVGAFVTLKSAAVKNSEEAIHAIADISTVMQKDMRDVAQAIVSTEVEPLRNMGILLERTGKQAVIQSGEMRLAVGNDIESIRQGLIKIMELNFGGAMAQAAGTFDTSSGHSWGR